MLNIIFSMMALERSALSVLFLMEILGQRKWPEKKENTSLTCRMQKTGANVTLKNSCFEIGYLEARYVFHNGF